MQIKQQSLLPYLQRKLSPVYWLIGQDNYLIEDSLNVIKRQIKLQHDCDEKMYSIQSASEWQQIIEEANNYSLFNDTTIINIVYDKKTLDASGKKTIANYLKSINSHCFIIIRSPSLPVKQLQTFVNNEYFLLVVAYPLGDQAMKHWISNELKKKSLLFESQIPELIQQYTQGNMLACAQVIEKLSLAYDMNSTITSTQVLEHAYNQCEHSLFDLIEACLRGQADKSIQILREVASNKTEATLVLWMITQEARTLLQLVFFLNQGVDLQTACSQLKIWSQRVALYQMSTKRLNQKTLEQLLRGCQFVDELIKSNLNTQTWNAIEQLALGLCLGRYIGAPCIA